MSKNNKVVKYKVINTNIDKKFIGKDLDLQKVKAKGGPGSDGGRKPPKPKAPAWFADFRSEVMQRFDGLENRLDRVIKVNNLKE